MTRLALVERQAICETFLRVGPDAATLCSPWRTRDLAAHLVIRDSRPDLIAGLFLSPLQGRLEAGMQEYATRPWNALVEAVRTGPPVWSPARVALVDTAMNTIEFFVHHEDVLRAGDVFAPRDLDPEHERGLWATITRLSRAMVRESDVGVVFVADGYGRFTARKPGPLGTVVVRGRPGELVLFASGRQRVADVELEGTEEALATLLSAKLGLA